MGLCQVQLAQGSTQQVLLRIRGTSAPCTCCSYISRLLWGGTRRMPYGGHRGALPAAAVRLEMCRLFLRASGLLMLGRQQGSATYIL